jgi:hypothetical protein
MQRKHQSEEEIREKYKKPCLNVTGTFVSLTSYKKYTVHRHCWSGKVLHNVKQIEIVWAPGMNCPEIRLMSFIYVEFRITFS